jgi:hypothetical protein
MPHFILTDKDTVNLDCVATADTSHDGKRTHLRDASGKLLGTCDASLDLELLTAPVVPAAPGERALIVYAWPSDGAPSTRPDETYVVRMQIPAWRIVRNVAFPILLEEPSSNSYVFVKLPGGRVIMPADTIFDDEAAAIEYALTTEQSRWGWAQERKTGKGAAR